MSPAEATLLIFLARAAARLDVAHLQAGGDDHGLRLGPADEQRLDDTLGRDRRNSASSFRRFSLSAAPPECQRDRERYRRRQKFSHHAVLVSVAEFVRIQPFV